MRALDRLERAIDAAAAAVRLSGVVRVDRGGDVRFAKAYGLAHRGFDVPNTTDTRFGIASGTKGITALTVMRLVEQRRLSITAPARTWLGRDLPSIDTDVTVEQLLAHRSGIGDYLDEQIDRPVTDYVMPLPVHELATTEDYLRVLDGLPPKFRAGERFSYCNSGYVVLALIAERSTGRPFHELVRHLVCEPAGMPDTAFLRSDELPGRTAIGYLDEDGRRTNVLHLPVRGNGDGGIYSTASDIRALWCAMFSGRIVRSQTLAEMIRPRSEAPEHEARYGLGFWLHPSGPAVELHGYDAGASFRSVHDPSAGWTYTVLSNTSEGAWPLSELLDELVS